MPLHLRWYIACTPPQQLGQQLGGTDLVVASAARAEELQARWATPPPYTPDARPVRALRPAPAAPRTRAYARARPLGPFGSINGCCWGWTDTWSWLDTSAPWRPRDGSTQLPRWPEAKCCQNSRERLPFSPQQASAQQKLPFHLLDQAISVARKLYLKAAQLLLNKLV